MKNTLRQHIETISYALLIILIYSLCLHYWDGLYVDTDNYTYALRITELFKNPTWFEQKFMMSNYPFGEISHWTRPIDILMMLCTLPFLPFYPVKEAVFHGGLLVTPLCLLLMAWYLKKIGDNILTLRARMALCILLFVQDNFRKIFLLNRPDHHAFDIFLAVFVLWQLYRFITSGGAKPIVYAALGCALALWVAVEGFVLYALTLLFLYFAHIFFKTSFTALCRFTGIYAAAVCMAWLLNPPYQGGLYIDIGRLSVFYVIVSAYIAACVWATAKLQAEGLRFASLSAATVILAMVLYFSGILVSPLDEQISIAFTNRISEMNKGTGFYFLTYPLIGLGILGVQAYKRQNMPLVMLLGIFLSCYLLLCIWAIRFAGYVSVYAALTVAYGLSRLKIKNVSFIFVTLGLMLLEIITFMVDAAMKYDLTEPMEYKQAQNISVLTAWQFAKGSVVSDVFSAPYIQWYAERPTIGSPYHNNIEGIVDNHNILFSEDEKEVTDLIKKHQVKTIIMLTPTDEKYYKEPLENCNKLYGKILGCGNYPQWLELKAQSEQGGFIILEVDEEKLLEEKNL